MSDKINLDAIFTWRNNNEILGKLQHYDVIPKSGEIKCPVNYCDGFFVLMGDTNKAEGVRWCCNGTVRKKKSKSKKCTKTASIRYKTFFYKTHLPLWKIVGFCYMWVNKDPLRRIMHEFSIAAHTAVDWANFCREVVFDAFITKTSKIGGPGKIVEIDESKFGKRKYHRGHRVEGSWVFGGYERGSGKVFMVVVADRTADTLLGLIERFIEKGTTIYSDCWKAYDNISENPNYSHLKVNHSINFKDPDTGCHTNSIESSWRHAKAAGPYANRKSCFLGGYLARYMFLKMAKELGQDPLVIFFMLARDLYDPNSFEEEGGVDATDEIEEGDVDEGLLDDFF